MTLLRLCGGFVIVVNDASSGAGPSRGAPQAKALVGLVLLSAFRSAADLAEIKAPCRRLLSNRPRGRHGPPHHDSALARIEARVDRQARQCRQSSHPGEYVRDAVRRDQEEQAKKEVSRSHRGSAGKRARSARFGERVPLNADGQVALKLKTPWCNGTTHLVMSPPGFMLRPAALAVRYRLVCTEQSRPAPLLDLPAERCAASTLAYLADYFGAELIEAAVARSAPALREDLFLALASRALAGRSTWPDLRQAMAEANSGPTIDDTPKEIYLSFRTALVGALSVKAVNFAFNRPEAGQDSLGWAA